MADTTESTSQLRTLIDGLPAELREAVFTHSSWLSERAKSYERLEFLGDSVLGLAIAHHLYRRLPDQAEGELARVRAHVVSRESCALVADELGLAADLAARGVVLGAMDPAALIESQAVRAALVEAAIGGCYVEHGFERVADAIVEAFSGRVDYALVEHVDYKTVLQEELARLDRSVTYVVAETSGPPHQRAYTSVAMVGGDELGRGSGSSKKASEQRAARQALEALRES
ncbi:MAG: ribonuclease III family protein [Gaiellales bacterium]